MTNMKEAEFGNIPLDWDFIPAEDYCCKVADGTHDTPKPVEKGYRLVTSKHIVSNHVDFSGAYFISENDYNDINKRSKVDQWDVLLSMIGTVGEAAIVEMETVDFAIKNVGLLKNKDELNARWLFYYLSSHYGKHYIKTRLRGTTQAYLPLGSIREMPILVPSENQEKAEIVSILKSFDSKINLLKQQNKTLVNIAQALFKHWFVDFEFPNEEGKPYKSSGGKMVASELGEIPEGWQVGNMENFGQIICGKTPPKNIRKYYGGNVDFIKIPDMHNKVFVHNAEDKLSTEGSDFQKNKLIPPNSINVSCIATVGLVTINILPAHTNQQINSIVLASENYLEYLFFYLKMLKKQLINIGTGGSATLNVNTGVFSRIEIIVPNKRIMHKYHSFTKSLFDKIKNNTIEIETLVGIRDTLLPKLMSGQIRVK